MPMLAERSQQTDHSKVSVPDNRGIKIVKSCTINRPAAELFQFWRKFENLPRVMEGLESVEQISDRETQWVARIGNKKFEWTSIIINEHENELIAWRTLDGSDVAHAGSVRFKTAPGRRGTEVTVAFEYEPPVGKLAAKFIKMLGKAPGLEVERDLMRFKSLMETGEIPTTEGQPTCKKD